MKTQTKSVQPVELLLVEDNDDDVVLTRESFRATSLPINLNRVENGEQCMAFLRKQPPFENAPTVELVLLDINMPRMDGREVMAAITAGATLRHLPVVVLTTSSAETDIHQMYARAGTSERSGLVSKVDLGLQQFLGELFRSDRVVHAGLLRQSISDRARGHLHRTTLNLIFVSQ